ncbi:hypothetical protein DV735_g4137, partial [Chaetothyriales sp. CBS 134920]
MRDEAAVEEFQVKVTLPLMIYCQSYAQLALQSELPKTRRASFMATLKRRARPESDDETDADYGGPRPSSAGPSRPSTPPSEFDSDYEEALMTATSQAVQRRFAQRGEAENTPAEHGILQKVELFDFMCHAHYEYELGPLINFICGKNGSGKSAILTAIVLCLGGKAAATNRGSSLKDFIRQGCNQARIICHVKNQGESAYQHDIYGDTIQVERHFSLTGPSGFKIKSIHGKIISTKRGDLEEICDHFNLQIENPLNVLSQDQARQFISSSSPSEKYKLFLKGVLLEQLDQDYRLIEEQLDNMRPKIEAAAADTEVLEQKYNTAEARREATRKQVAWRAELTRIGRLCTWAQIEEQEQLLAQHEQAVSDQLVTIAESERKLEEFQHNVVDPSKETCEVTKEAYEKASEELKQAQDELAQARELAQRTRAERTSAAAELLHAKTAIQKNTERIAKKQQEIRDEEQRLEEQDGGGTVRREQELAEAQTAAEQAKQARLQHANTRGQLESAQQMAREDEEKAKSLYNQKQEEVVRQSNHLQDVQKRQQVQDTAFHPSMPQILRDINRETRFNSRPIGPVGKHVKLLNPEWSSVLERSFGNTLSGFIVFSKADEHLLSSITRRYSRGGPPIPILLGNNIPLDTSGKEPDEQFKTMMRVLDIDNEHVRKILIIMHSIDNTGLIQDQTEASRVLFNDRPRNLARCYCIHPKDKTKAMFLSLRGGQPAQDPVSQWLGASRMKTNNEAQVRIQQELVEDASSAAREAKAALDAAKNAVLQATKALERHKKEATELKVAAQQAEVRVEEIRDAIKDDGQRMSTLEALRDALASAELDKETIGHLYMDALKASDSKTAEVKVARGNEANAESRVKELQEGEIAARRAMERAGQKKTADIRTSNELENVLHEDQRLLAELEKKRDEKKKLVDDWTARAEQDFARPNIPAGETHQSLEAKFQSMQKRIREAQRKSGNAEEVEKMASEAQTAFLKAKKDLQNLRELEEALKESLFYRQCRWKHFRGHISVTARSQFRFFLSERGFRGEVILDHEQKLLDVRVEPDTTQRDGAGRSARTLSGGEKSFSQICLLLSIWEAMGSPIRCLDEFDVFMDAVNRSTSVSLLIEAARQSRGRQFILISPGTKSDIKKAPDVHTIEYVFPFFHTICKG